MTSDGAPMAAQGERPRPARRFSSNVRWTLLGTAANSAGNWLLVVILARSSGPAAVGDYAIALALTAPVMSFAGLQMRTLLASDAGRSHTFGEYMRVCLIAAGLGVVACVVLARLVGDGGGGWLVLGAVCAMRAADAVADVYSGLWQQRERMRIIGVGRVIQSAAAVAFVSVACGLGAGSAGAAMAGAFGAVLLVAFMHLGTARDRDRAQLAAPGGWSWPRLGRLALQGLPLGAIVLLGVLQANVPRYFIEQHAGHVALGLFAAASQLTTSGNVVVGALGAAALPRLAAAHAAGTADLRSLTSRLCLAGAGLGLAGVALSALLGRELLVFLYRPEFGEAADVLLVLSLAAGLGFVASFLGYVLTASRVIVIQPLLLLVTLGVMVALCALLVPRAGAVGAAWAMAGGSAVQVAGSWLALRRAHAAGKQV